MCAVVRLCVSDGYAFNPRVTVGNRESFVVPG